MIRNSDELTKLHNVLMTLSRLQLCTSPATTDANMWMAVSFHNPKEAMYVFGKDRR